MMSHLKLTAFNSIIDMYSSLKCKIYYIFTNIRYVWETDRLRNSSFFICTHLEESTNFLKSAWKAAWTTTTNTIKALSCVVIKITQFSFQVNIAFRRLKLKLIVSNLKVNQKWIIYSPSHCSKPKWLSFLHEQCTRLFPYNKSTERKQDSCTTSNLLKLYVWGTDT